MSKSNTPNPEVLTEDKSSRGRSLSRKRQLSQSSENQMQPPASRQRSLSVTRTPAQTQSHDTITFKTQGQAYNMNQLVEDTLKKPDVLQSILPTLKQEINHDLLSQMKVLITQSVEEAVERAVQSAVKPLNELIAKQDHKLIKLFDKCHELKTENNNIKKQLDESLSRSDSIQKINDELKARNDELETSVIMLETKLEDLEQYGRRTSLRFHNVPMREAELQHTDDLVLKVINTSLKIAIPLKADDINRSHIIGKIKDGKGQIICRFRNWKVKNLVYGQRKFLRDNPDKIFITEDLTRYRQNIVKKLSARKRARDIHSFWTYDGRVFAKKIHDGDKILIKTPDEVDLI